MNGTQESITAKICSFARAYHSCYSDEVIFNDPMALKLMGSDEFREVGEHIAEELSDNGENKVAGFPHVAAQKAINTYICPIILSRLSWSDKAQKEFAASVGGATQCVICGAGMDTFAFRSSDENVRIFEVDHPSTQSYKLKRLEEIGSSVPDNVVYVPVDFSKQDLAAELLRAGYNSSVPSFFTILGVSYYLPFDVFAGTLQRIADIAPAGSRVAFDFPASEAEERIERLSELTASLGEPMAKSYNVREVEERANALGYDILSHEAPEQIQREYFDGRADKQCAYKNVHFMILSKRT